MADSIFGIAVLLICGIFLFGIGLNSYRKKKLIENIPTSKIRSIAMGLVEIKGKAVKHVSSFVAPFSNKKCLYYKVQVDKLVRSGKSSRWVTIHKRIMTSPFFVKDTTGKVLVNPLKAEVDLKPSFKYQTGFFGKSMSKRLISFCDSSKIRYKNFLGMKNTLRFLEYSIPVNKEVYVLGSAVHNKFAKPGARESASLMITKDLANNIFYISDKKEEKITGNLMLASVVGTLVGAIMIILSVYLITKTF